MVSYHKIPVSYPPYIVITCMNIIEYYPAYIHIPLYITHQFFEPLAHDYITIPTISGWWLGHPNLKNMSSSIKG